MYQSYGKVVLGLGEADRVSEELDAREVGDAVHKALELSAPSMERRTETPEAARRTLVEALRTHGADAFNATRDSLPSLTAAGQAATVGLEARWHGHWERWAEGRIRRPGMPDPRSIDALLNGHPDLLRAASALSDAGEAANLEPMPDWRARLWLVWAARHATNNDVSRFDSYVLLGTGERGALEAGWEPVLRGFVGGDVFQRLTTTAKNAFRNAEVLRGRIRSEQAEVAFEVSLPLGSSPLTITGTIDRISMVEAADTELLAITDYKSGAARSVRDVRKDVANLRSPQLPLYALALRVLQTRVVAGVGYDFLRVVHDEHRNVVGATEAVLVDDVRLDATQQALGALVDEARAGRWPLRPRKDTCPVLAGPWEADHCPFAGACRLRGLGAE
jgi:RecB family exonuclease